MSPLSPPVQALLELFQGPLAAVRFADVDGASLSTAARSVEAAALTVAEQEAELALLRQTLADRQEALLVLAQRAVAYARVYAENDDTLSEQLAAISLPRPARPARPTKARKGGSAASDEPASVPELAATEGSEAPTDEAARGGIATEASNTADAQSSDPQLADAPVIDIDPESPDAPAPRKGKRRGNVAREEQSRPV